MSEGPATESFPAMGTLAMVSVEAADARPCLTGARRVVEELERRLSRFLSDSDVSRINRGAGSFVSVGGHAAELARLAVTLAGRTRGAFNPLVGKAVARWRSIAEHAPDGGEVARFGAEEIAGDGGRVRIPAGSALDFGGIAKGYAADLAARACLTAGATRAVVSLGTSSIAVGPAGARPANVGISSPYDGIEGVLGELRFSGSLSVSGRYAARIGAEAAASHIIDPATMRPARSDVASVAVVGPDGASAEAFSTAMVALGVDAALELGLREELQLVLFAVDGRVLASPGIAAGFRMRPGVQERLARSRTGPM